MKIRSILPVFFAMLLLTGCELFGTFSASINGNLWQPSVFGAAKNGNQYVISASKDNATLVITLPSTSPGTYIINPNDTALDAVLYTPDFNSPGNYYLSTQGEVNLTKVDNGRVTGNFNAYAKNSITASDSIPISGQFSNILSN